VRDRAPWGPVLPKGGIAYFLNAGPLGLYKLFFKKKWELDYLFLSPIVYEDFVNSSYCKRN
jgi:hypothetical protein